MSDLEVVGWAGIGGGGGILTILNTDNTPAHTGLENCTRPLVFTSGSSVRASGNCHLLARQDE